LSRSNVHIDPSANVSVDTSLSPGCFIGANVSIIGRCKFNSNVRVEPNVILYGPIEVENNTYVGPNSVLGFPHRRALDVLLKKGSFDTVDMALTQIGKSVVIRTNCVLYSGVIIEDGVKFGHNCMVREGTSIGKRTMIGTNSVIDGDSVIGKDVSMQTGVYVPTNSVIEDHVFLGPYCVLTNDLYMSRKPYELKGPVIREYASIGANATIFPDIEIGEGAVVGAGAVVRENVPPRTVFVGVPAKKLKDVPSDWKIS
jgi:acetyltransferase-like isoleucine patch superfamily enzyme